MTVREQFDAEHFFNEHMSFHWNKADVCRALELAFRAGTESRWIPPESCLLCGQSGDKAVVHEPSGVWVCMKCRGWREIITLVMQYLSAHDHWEAYKYAIKIGAPDLP